MTTIFAYRLAAKSANDSYDAFLLNSADSIAARLSRNEYGVVVADLPLSAQAILKHDGDDKFYYQIVDSQGHRLTGDKVLPLPRTLLFIGTKFRDSNVDGQNVRMCRIPIQLSPSPSVVWVQVAETLNSRQRLLRRIFLSILVPQIMLLVLASWSVWLGVRHGLVPLNKLGWLLQSRSQFDLSPVDIANPPIELIPVIKALNDLLLNTSKQMNLQRQFIGNAAHQLRTPVTALQTYVDYAQRINENVALTKVFKQIAEATGRTVHLINRLLSLARAEENNRLASMKLVDLTAAVNSAAANLVQLALRKEVELYFDIPEAEVYVWANQADLDELVTNLLENAIKYVQKSGLVWVSIDNSEQVVLIIEDNGPGIPNEEKTKVFERFYRGSTTNSSGSGLGLAIVSEIVSYHNAKIQLADRLGGGTTFRVIFPKVEQTEKIC